jgi:hypothetical protein
MYRPVTHCRVKADLGPEIYIFRDPSLLVIACTVSQVTWTLMGLPGLGTEIKYQHTFYCEGWKVKNIRSGLIWPCCHNSPLKIIAPSYWFIRSS